MEWLCWWLYPQDSFTISHYLCFAIVWLWLLVWRLRPHSLGHNNHLLDCNWRPHLNKHNTDIMYQTPHKSNFKSSFMVKLNYFALQMTCFHCSLVKQIGSDESLYERKVSDWLFWLLYLWCGEESSEMTNTQALVKHWEGCLHWPIRGQCWPIRGCHHWDCKQWETFPVKPRVWGWLNWIRMQCRDVGGVKIILLNCLTVEIVTGASLHPHNLKGKCKQ